MATGSLPAALSLPAAISGGCARWTPPCATALLDLRCTLGALVAPRLRHRLALLLLLLLLNRPPCATRLAGALRPLAVRALYACERVDLGTNGCAEAVERLPFDRRMLMPVEPSSITTAAAAAVNHKHWL